MMRYHAAHCFGDGRLSLQSFQIILDPEQVRTEHNSQGGVRHLGVSYVLSHFVQERAEVLEEVQVDRGNGSTVTSYLLDKV
jgi:hypothetical protein